MKNIAGKAEEKYKHPTAYTWPFKNTVAVNSQVWLIML